MKTLSRRALEMWGSDNTDDPDAILAADYINHQESDVEGGVSARRLSEWKALVDGHRWAFGLSEFTILMQIAEADTVATRWQFTVKHTGDFRGVAPTGKTITWTGVQIDRHADGKIVESWVDWDKYRFYQGLGLVS